MSNINHTNTTYFSSMDALTASARFKGMSTASEIASVGLRHPSLRKGNMHEYALFFAGMMMNKVKPTDLYAGIGRSLDESKQVLVIVGEHSGMREVRTYIGVWDNYHRDWFVGILSKTLTVLKKVA